MNLAFPILMLVFGGLTFWLLTESKVRWYFKVSCISAFCLFTVIFWLTSHSFLGWPALERELPQMVNIHAVIIKEPNKSMDFPGKIYLWLETSEKPQLNPFLKFFGYKGVSIPQPRAFEMRYNRKLHEQLEREVIPKIRQGQIARGKLVKGTASANGQNGKAGKSKGNDKNAGKGGSESKEQEWVFHELRPGEIHRKPDAR